MSHYYCLVKCPQFGCGWSGFAAGNSCDSDSWSGFEPTVTIVAFECPCCHHEWRARVVAGKAKQAMPQADDEVAVHWPPAEIGVGE